MRRYLGVVRLVNRGEASRGALTKAQQREMDSEVRMLRSAGEQGLTQAQFGIGCMFGKAHGAEQDYAEAVRWFRKAAD